MYQKYSMNEIDLSCFLSSCLFEAHALLEEDNLNVISGILPNYNLNGDYDTDVSHLSIREAM